MKWWRSRYVQFLEIENAELKTKVAAYERILIPRLAAVVSPNRPAMAPASDGEKKPAVHSSPIQIKRHSWQEARAKLEFHSDTQGAALEKAARAHKDLQ